MLSKSQLVYFTYIVVVIIASLLPGRQLEGIGYFDKLGHFLAYTLMSLFGLIVFRTRGSRIAVIIFCLLLGVALELIQATVSERDASLADGIANILGVFVGVGIFLLARRTRNGEGSTN